jgi:hypothetical protein
MIRAAEWVVWTTYTLLVVAVAIFAWLVRSKRMDIAETMTSVVLLGGIGGVGAAALLCGAALGTVALAARPEARRPAPLATVLAGWIGAASLIWISVAFWGH